MDQEPPEGRHTVGREFHYKGRLGAFENRGANEFGGEQRKAPGKEGEVKHHTGLVFGEKGANKHSIYG